MRGNGMHHLFPQLRVAGEYTTATPRKVKPEDRRRHGKERAGRIKWLDEHGWCVKAICERLAEPYGYVMDVLQGRVHLHGPSIEPPPIPQAPAGAPLPAQPNGETMTYSFEVRAKTKAEAIEAVSDKFDQLVIAQPAHKADRAAVRAGVTAFVNALGHKPGHDIVVTVGGSVSIERTPAKPAVPAVAAVEAVEAREATDTEPAVEAVAAVAEVAYQAAVPELETVGMLGVSVSAYLVSETSAA